MGLHSNGGPRYGAQGVGAQTKVHTLEWALCRRRQTSVTAGKTLYGPILKLTVWFLGRLDSDKIARLLCAKLRWAMVRLIFLEQEAAVVGLEIAEGRVVHRRVRELAEAAGPRCRSRTSGRRPSRATGRRGHA